MNIADDDPVVEALFAASAAAEMLVELREEIDPELAFTRNLPRTPSKHRQHFDMGFAAGVDYALHALLSGLPADTERVSIDARETMDYYLHELIAHLRELTNSHGSFDDAVAYLRAEGLEALNFDAFDAELKARVLTALFGLSYAEFESLRVLLADWSGTYVDAVEATRKLVN